MEFLQMCIIWLAGSMLGWSVAMHSPGLSFVAILIVVAATITLLLKLKLPN